MTAVGMVGCWSTAPARMPSIGTSVRSTSRTTTTFADQFGKTIVGYFYDEPETFGDWGTEVIPMLKQRGVNWQKALVAWKFQLSDPDEQVAAKYQYQDALAETLGPDALRRPDPVVP